MAEVTFVACPAREDGRLTHCFHAILYPSMHQAGQWNSTGKEQCCWCGEERPQQIFYGMPVAHGPKRPEGPDWAAKF